MRRCLGDVKEFDRGEWQQARHEAIRDAAADWAKEEEKRRGDAPKRREDAAKDRVNKREGKGMGKQQEVGRQRPRTLASGRRDSSL